MGQQILSLTLQGDSYLMQSYCDLFSILFDIGFGATHTDRQIELSRDGRQSHGDDVASLYDSAETLRPSPCARYLDVG